MVTFLNCGSYQGGNFSKTYIIKPIHINVLLSKILKGCSPFRVFPHLTVFLEFFIGVGDPNEIKFFNMVACCCYSQSYFFDIFPGIRPAFPEGKRVALGTKIHSYSICRYFFTG